jgi:hypothetical protein
MNQIGFLVPDPSDETVEELPKKTKESLTESGIEMIENKDYKSYRGTKCAICGCLDSLTVHHIVPQDVLKAFGLQRIPLNDIVTLCHEHHEEYEKHASLLKTSLSQRNIGAMMKRQANYYIAQLSNGKSVPNKQAVFDFLTAMTGKVITAKNIPEKFPAKESGMNFIYNQIGVESLQILFRNHFMTWTLSQSVIMGGQLTSLMKKANDTTEKISKEKKKAKEKKKVKKTKKTKKETCQIIESNELI